jgi:hypothetical protein
MIMSHPTIAQILRTGGTVLDRVEDLLPASANPYITLLSHSSRARLDVHLFDAPMRDALPALTRIAARLGVELRREDYSSKKGASVGWAVHITVEDVRIEISSPHFPVRPKRGSGRHLPALGPDGAVRLVLADKLPAYDWRWVITDADRAELATAVVAETSGASS